MDRRYAALLQEQADLVAEGDALVAAAEASGTEFTEEQNTRYAAIATRLRALGVQIAVEEQMRDARKATADAAHSRASADVTGLHDRAADKPFANLGEQLHAIYQASVNHDANARARLMAVAQGNSEAVDSEGGFLLQDQFSSGIDRLMHDTGTVLGLVTEIPVSSNALVERQVDEVSRADGARSGGVQGYWVDEAATIPTSRPRFRRMRTELQKAAALGYSTDELLDDFVAMAAVFEQEFAEELLFKIEDAIIEGDGAGKPLGIINATNPCLITVLKESAQVADTIVTANLSKMWVRLPVRSRANAVWFINGEVEPQLDVLTIPAGTAALEPRFVTYDQQGIMRIKGRPVVPIEYASAIGDKGDIILADMSQYRLIGKGGVQQASSIHVAFATDETAFRAIKRVGGQPKWKSALTPFKGSASVSPFVTLEAR